MAVKRLGRVWIAMVAIVLGIVPAGAALSQESVTVAIHKNAVLMADGQAIQVLVQVVIDCDPATTTVLEAVVTISQDGNESQFAGIPVNCGDPPRTYPITVRAFEETPFHRGEARVSAFVLLYNTETEETAGGGASILVVVR